MNERDFGFKVIEQGTLTKVNLVAPYSPSWRAGIFNNDDVIAVNGTVVRNNLNQLLNYYSNQKSIDITIISQEKLRTVTLQKDEKEQTWFFKSKLSILAQSADKQKDSFNIWKTF
ncbi:MAG: PDZ domain-containing protein [Sphingobacteriaceae bacterium]|nr:PDZ domain-containing protein [Sphingobacteriaceae bacterium]